MVLFMVYTMKDNGLKEKNMEEVNFKINQQVCITKNNGFKEKRMELDIYRFRVKVFMKEPLKQTTELASVHRDFRIQISIRVSIKWKSFTEKVFTYGLLEPVSRGFFLGTQARLRQMEIRIR